MTTEPSSDPQKRLAELHGKTCVVETRDHKTYVGRCSRFENEQLIMVDLDQIEGDFKSPAVTQYLDNALQTGHWPRVKKVFIPKAEITRMDLLVKTPWRG